MPGIADRAIRRLVERFGSGRAALRAPARAFQSVAGERATASRGETARRDAVLGILDRCRRLPVRVAPIGSRGYPRRLWDLTDPPPLLFLRGEPSLLERPAVAVVGSRRATAYGRRTSESIGAHLAAAGVVVVSGLALGVDGAAHRGALKARGGTVAVLGSGIDRPHPPSHGRLFEKIAEDGLLVSEFLPGSQPLPHHFPQRNRIIAALSRAVVVVEAAERSGALITVDHALDLGRDVFAVPGSVERANSRGTNAMIRDGAGIVTSPEALANEMDWLDRPLRGAREASPRKAVRPNFADPDEERLWLALEEESHHVDVLSRKVGLDPGRTLAALLSLEMGGLVVQRGGMRFARSGDPAPSSVP